MSELRPCPYCGQPAFIARQGMKYYVECFHKTNCYLFDKKAPRFNVKEAMVLMWNRRRGEKRSE